MTQQAVLGQISRRAFGSRAHLFSRNPMTGALVGTMMRGGRGERAIGQVYAANTLGAIAGVLVAVNVLVPEAGLKVALVIGAA